MSEVVYQRIADDLRDRISDGRLAPGQNVPTEAELAAAWATSRGPIRNALAVLRAEGMIDTGRGRPARVVQRKPAQAVDASIPFTRWAQSIGARPGAITQEVARRRADADTAEAFGIAAGDAVVEVLRLRLLDDRPTMLEQLVYLADLGSALLSADLDRVSITELLVQHGFPQTDVEHEIDAVAADARTARLLEVPEKSPILRLHRVSRDADGRIIEVSDDLYRSDIVRFTVSPTGRAARPTGGVPYLRGLGTPA